MILELIFAVIMAIICGFVAYKLLTRYNKKKINNVAKIKESIGKYKHFNEGKEIKLDFPGETITKPSKSVKIGNFKSIKTEKKKVTLKFKTKKGKTVKIPAIKTTVRQAKKLVKLKYAKNK